MHLRIPFIRSQQGPHSWGRVVPDHLMTCKPTRRQWMRFWHSQKTSQSHDLQIWNTHRPILFKYKHAYLPLERDKTNFQTCFLFCEERKRAKKKPQIRFWCRAFWSTRPTSCWLFQWDYCHNTHSEASVSECKWHCKQLPPATALPHQESKEGPLWRPVRGPGMCGENTSINVTCKSLRGQKFEGMMDTCLGAVGCHYYQKWRWSLSYRCLGKPPCRSDKGWHRHCPASDQRHTDRTWLASAHSCADPASARCEHI